MKAIKIAKENEQAIEQALHEINGRSNTHCYTTYGEIEHMAQDGEKFLAGLKLPLKERAGATRIETSGGKVANSYKGMRNATTVYIERRGSAWFVTTICRSEIYNNGGGSAAYVVTKAQDESAKRRFAEQYSVKKESEQ